MESGPLQPALHGQGPTTLPPLQVPLLQARGITKSFPGVQALQDVTFLAREGEVHALMGENGAGKSTLIKVLTGVHRRDRGALLLQGHLIEPRSPAEAERLGISTVYQEVNLLPHLSVAENIALGRQKTGRIFFEWAAARQRAEEALKRLGLSLDVTESLGAYSIAIQQMVAIARAIAVSAKILILDEPTSSLDANEVERLFAVLRQLKSEGMSIVFVTHFLDQVYAISDRITVLRNGKLVGEYETAALPRIQLVSKMMGKELADWDVKQVARPVRQEESSPLLALRGAGRSRMLHPLDIDIYPGEVLGLAGLLGSGRTETARLIFGIAPADKGDIYLDGAKTRIDSPLRAIKHKIGFCPEDRKTEGLIPNLTVRENIMLAMQSSRGWMRYLSRTKQLELANQFIDALRIATPSPEQQVKLLSGGNQQKVILARWLASNPRLLLLDEPTRGIDVGAKLEIEKLVGLLASEGMAILFISSDLEELVRNSHRVVVLRDRLRVADIPGESLNEATIMQAIAAPQEISPPV